MVFFFFFKQKTAYEMLRSLVGSEMCIRDSSHQLCECPGLFWVHVDGELVLLSHDGNHWGRGLPLVHHQDLRSHQDRLMVRPRSENDCVRAPSWIDRQCEAELALWVWNLLDLCLPTR
eukprot:TRINITY_DN20293_c0_g1_i4.p2 TRINITY_DN20293_c0_g1~~TRINITY_DN20293_c0_g1_i4.p2  ORF type:complete len:118 (+),score=23.58 TRINITY_DN20293_c0_g1_i4:84-437(+)